MSKNLSYLSGRKGLEENLFEKLGELGEIEGTPKASDIKALAKLLQTHRDSDRLGAMYNEQRRIDVESRTKAVDILNRSLLVDILPGQMAKVAGLQLLLNCQPLRKTVMKLGISQYKF